MSDIKDRIRQIMRSEGLTAMAFAENIGVAQATVSHVLGPRNKYPSTEFLLRLHNRYPDVDLNWLLTGQGTMKVGPSTDDEHPNDALPDPALPLLFGADELDGTDYDVHAGGGRPTAGARTEVQRPSSGATEQQPRVVKVQRHVVEIRVFYDDNTYEVFTAPK